GYAATAPAQAGSWPPTAATPTNAAPPVSEPARPARESPAASRGAATVAAARPQPASQVRYGSMGQSPATAAAITRPPRTTAAFAPYAPHETAASVSAGRSTGPATARRHGSARGRGSRARAPPTSVSTAPSACAAIPRERRSGGSAQATPDAALPGTRLLPPK